MKRRILWSSIGAALIIIGITAAWAETQHWHGWRGHAWFHHGPPGFATHELKLSDEQTSQIQSLWDAERSTIAVLVHEIATDEREMDAAARQGAPEESKVQDIAARQSATVAKLLVEKEQLTSKIYRSVLTPEQRTKADELQKRWSTRLDRLADRLGNATGRK